MNGERAIDNQGQDSGSRTPSRNSSSRHGSQTMRRTTSDKSFRSHASSSSLRGSIPPKSRAALIVRTVLLGVMAAAAITISLLVYFYTTAQDNNEFHAQFQSDAQKILRSIGAAFSTTLAATENFAAAICAQKRLVNGTFPFVALANYPLQASKVKALSKAFVTSIHYFVSEDQRSEWEEFAAANNQFVQQAWDLQSQDESWQGSLQTFPNIQNQLFANAGVVPPGDGPYLVAWQNYPIIYRPNGAAYNFDVFSLPSQARHWLPVIQSKQPAVWAFENVLDPHRTPSVQEQENVDFVRNFIPPNDNPAEPVLTLIYPIIDQNEEIQVDTETLNEDQFVGTVSLSLFWRDLLRNILPDKSQGIYVVTDNRCGQTFTHEISGSDAMYIANTDAHESRYDDLLVSESFAAILESSSSVYSGVPLSDGTCSIQIKIYPSSRYKDATRDTKADPVVLAVSAGLIFVLAGSIFLAYDYLLDLGRRQIR